MDTRCPHCRNELTLRFLRRYQRKGFVLSGDMALSCPHCAGAISFNSYPPEADLPFHLTGKSAAFAIFGIAWLIGFMVSPFFSVGITTAALSICGFAALGIQQWHLYNVKLANFSVYRSAKVQEIEAWKPTL